MLGFILVFVEEIDFAGDSGFWWEKANGMVRLRDVAGIVWSRFAVEERRPPQKAAATKARRNGAGGAFHRLR